MAEAQAAVAIVRARAPRESILLIRRSERQDDPWSGHWSFPGGRRDPDDPDLLHTALRELREECGVHLRREQLETTLPPRVARRRSPPFLMVAPFVFTVEEEMATVLDEREAVQALWLELARCVDTAQHCLCQIPGQPPDLHYPAIPLNGTPLWGFTYRLITSWLGLCPEHGAAEEAAFQAASRVLDFLLSQGLRLKQGWAVPSEANVAAGEALKLAVVEGEIPVAQVRAHFCAPGEHVRGVGALDVQPDCIRLAGLAFEEYWIRASR